MTPTGLYRTASMLHVLATAGNTYAVVRFWQAGGALNSMPLPEDHRVKYGPVVLALGVFCSMCIAFASYLSWHLGQLAKTAPHAIGNVGWALFVYQILGVYVSFSQLSGVVRMLSVALAICTGSAAWLTRRSGVTTQAD